MTPIYYSDFVGPLNNMGAPYQVRTDQEALRAEFKVPNSVEIHRAVVLAGQAHFFFNRGDRYVGYADEVIGFRPPD